MCVCSLMSLTVSGSEKTAWELVLPPPRGSWESNSGHQTWWQVFLPTWPPCWPHTLFFKIVFLVFLNSHSKGQKDLKLLCPFIHPVTYFFPITNSKFSSLSLVLFFHLHVFLYLLNYNCIPQIIIYCSTLGKRLPAVKKECLNFVFSSQAFSV